MKDDDAKGVEELIKELKDFPWRGCWPKEHVMSLSDDCIQRLANFILKRKAPAGMVIPSCQVCSKCMGKGCDICHPEYVDLPAQGVRWPKNPYDKETNFDNWCGYENCLAEFKRLNPGVKE